MRVLAQDSVKNTAPLLEIGLSEEAVEVKVHAFDPTGGFTGQEWPWKLLHKGQGEGDKWCCGGGGHGWVEYIFRKPLLIRGYGLKSANDFPVRDPKDFSLWVMNALDERPENE